MVCAPAADVARAGPPADGTVLAIAQSVAAGNISRRMAGPPTDAARALEALLAATDDAVIVTDLDSIITTWNAAAERLYGFTADEILGRRIAELCTADREHEERSITERVLAGEVIHDIDTVR